MLKILLVRSNKAFLPEIDAYIKFFNGTREFRAYDFNQLGSEFEINDFDIIWEFKGLGGYRRLKDRILIHEYASLSTGSFPYLKNKVKTKFNPKPNLRVFLNENVKKGFGFTDGVDYCYRDMGIDESFINTRSENKEYDFVYIGSICRDRGIDKLLVSFIEKRMGKLCLVGNVEDDLYTKYKSNKDLIFTGKVPYSEVPKIASKAVYGINYIPNRYPYNIQTSTKLLEYLALGLKVITTDYKWVRQFEKKHGCNFFKLDPAKNRFEKNLSEHEYRTNFNADDFLWPNIIRKSGIMNKLIALYNK